MAEERIGYLIAGGRAAMFDTLADAEDDGEEGARAAAAVNPGDVLIAIAASGTTPYTVAAARRARDGGAAVIAVVNNRDTPLAAAADHAIVLDSGPEVIAGSTRLGAGTALTHIKLGAVHDGLMVNVLAGNRKLQARARRIVSQISGASAENAAAALALSRGAVKPAVLICAGATAYDAAQQLLAETNGNLRLALERLAAP
jgi:N-acetylmuramic acid 6-phosphate etherase